MKVPTRSCILSPCVNEDLYGLSRSSHVVDTKDPCPVLESKEVGGTGGRKGFSRGDPKRFVKETLA